MHFFHQVNLVKQEESRSPKFTLGSDIAPVRVWRSLRISDTFAELSEIYTQHFVLMHKWLDFDLRVEKIYTLCCVI
jgi:hypothetical protein